MKITDKLAKAEREGRPFWSFEYFPPRTAQVSAHGIRAEEETRPTGLSWLSVNVQMLRLACGQLVGSVSALWRLSRELD